MTLNKQIGCIKMYEVTGKADDLAKRKNTENFSPFHD